MDPPPHSSGAEDVFLLTALCFVGGVAWCGWERGERMGDCWLAISKGIKMYVVFAVLSCVCTLQNNHTKTVILI